MAISLRDSLIPRRSYVERIRRIAEAAGVPHQLEVEGSGGSDAKELQHGAQPWDWCFIGAPEDNVHSPDEIVDKRDIDEHAGLVSGADAEAVDSPRPVVMPPAKAADHPRHECGCGQGFFARLQIQQAARDRR